MKGLRLRDRAHLRRRVAALLVSVVAFTLLVLAPRAASAAAPMCDPRAAVVFAPAPQLQDPETSIDLGLEEDCGGFAASDRAITPDGGGSTWDSPASPSATLPAALVVVHAASPVSELSRAAEGAPRSAHLSRVDRPPRA